MIDNEILKIPYHGSMKIKNKLNNSEVTLEKDFIYDTEYITSYCLGKSFLLYEGNVFNLFDDVLSQYLINNNIIYNSIEIKSIEITSSDKLCKIVCNENKEGMYDFNIRIYAYYSDKDSLDAPKLTWDINDTHILWRVDNQDVAHKIVDENENIISNLPIGTLTFSEEVIEGKTYKRKAIAYNEYTKSNYSPLITFEIDPKQIQNSEYNKFNPLYESNNNIIPINKQNERFKAFKSGIGDGLDLKVYKPNETKYSNKFELMANIYGIYYESVSVPKKTNFNYRIEYEGDEDYKSVDGEFEFALEATGDDFLTVRVYRYATKTETIKAYVEAKVSYYAKSGTSWEQRVKTIISEVYEKTLPASTAYYHKGSTASLIHFENVQMNPNINIKDAIMKKAKEDSDIKYSLDNNKEVIVYNYNIYDDYYFSYENKFSKSKPREFKSTLEGSIYVTSSNNDNNMINPTGVPLIHGYANSQLFDVEKTFNITVPYSDTNVVLLSKEEIDALIPTNIDDRSYVFDGDTNNIVTKIEIIKKGSTVMYEPINLNSNAVIKGRSLNSMSSNIIYNKFDLNNLQKYYYADKILNMPSDDLSYKYRYNYQLNIKKSTPGIKLKIGTMEYSLDTNKVFTWTDDKSSMFSFYTVSETLTRKVTGLYPAAENEAFSGSVNSVKDNNGKYIKKDMIVHLPEIPFSSDLKNVKFSIVISDVYPKSSLITCKIYNADSTGYTNVNGDYVTFSSYSTINEAKKFKELVAVESLENIILNDDSTIIKNVIINKPESTYADKYSNYELLLYANTNDIDISEYPNEIDFLNSDSLNISYKIKILKTASGKWSPLIHNGFYYLNQDEYYLYSESAISGVYEDIIRYVEKLVYYTLNINLKTIENIETDIFYKLKSSEYFENAVVNNIIVSDFIYPKPSIDTKYYKLYEPVTFLTNIIRFDKIIKEFNYIKWIVSENLNQTKVYIRLYDPITGEFSEWSELTNNSKPTLSQTRHIQFKIEFNVKNEYELHQITETISSYNDFVDDCDFNKSYQISISSGMLQQSYTESIVNSVYNSVILDYGCEETEVKIDKYYNLIQNDVDGYIVIHAAASNNYNDLILNPNWILMDGINFVKGRYVRYRIEFNHNVVVLSIYKNIKTKKSVNKVEGIKDLQLLAIGIDDRQNISNISIDKSAKVIFDKNPIVVANNVYDEIEYTLFSYGFTTDDVKDITVQSKDDDVVFNISEKEYDFSLYKISNLLSDWKETNSNLLNHWRFDDTNNSIYHNLKTDYLSGFITSRKHKYYSIETTVTSKSSSLNPIGLIAAYETDSLGNEYTLSLLVSPSYFSNDLGEHITYSIYYNYGKSDEYLLYSKSLNSNINSWSELTNGIRIKVVRNLNTITFYRSSNDATNYNISFNVSINVLDYPMLSIFREGSYFGICDISQESSIFKDFSISINDPINSNIVATSNIVQINNENSSYIEFINNKSTVSPLPKQFSPITLESKDGTSFKRVFFKDKLINEETFVLNSKNYKLSYTDIDESSIEIYIDNVLVEVEFNIVNNFIFTNINVDQDKYITFKYKIKDSFYVDYNITNDCIDIYINPTKPVTHCFINYETNEFDNKKEISYLSLNPIYNSNYEGFIYITDEVYKPTHIEAHYNPNYVYANGIDTINICVELLDEYNNSVTNEELSIDALYGEIKTDSYITDFNGVVSFKYTSSSMPCTDTITISCFSDLNIKKEIKIINLEV